jgi:hypothetical protein
MRLFFAFSSKNIQKNHILLFLLHSSDCLFLFLTRIRQAYLKNGKIISKYTEQDRCNIVNFFLITIQDGQINRCKKPVLSRYVVKAPVKVSNKL